MGRQAGRQAGRGKDQAITKQHSRGVSERAWPRSPPPPIFAFFSFCVGGRARPLSLSAAPDVLLAAAASRGRPVRAADRDWLSCGAWRKGFILLLTRLLAAAAAASRLFVCGQPSVVTGETKKAQRIDLLHTYIQKPHCCLVLSLKPGRSRHERARTPPSKLNKTAGFHALERHDR